MERLRQIGLQLLVVILVIIGLFIFKSMVFGNFEVTASLGFIVTAFFIAGMVMVIVSTFAEAATAKRLNYGVVAILVLVTGWSILVNTSAVAAESNKVTATGWYAKFSHLILPANSYNSEVALQAEVNCDRLTAIHRRSLLDESDATYEKDRDLKAYIERRAKIENDLSLSAQCKTGNAPSSFGNSSNSNSTTPPVVSVPAGEVVKSGAIAVSKPFTDIGTYSGKIVIVMSGTAKLDSTRGNFGPSGWTSGGSAPKFFQLPGATMFSAIAKVNGKKQYVGDSLQLDLSGPTRIEIGPNEEPGKDGLGYKDNGGNWSYEVRQIK